MPARTSTARLPVPAAASERPRSAMTGEVGREVAATLLVLAALFTLLSLVFGGHGNPRVGAVGNWIETALTFILGKALSFTIPLAVGWFGVSLFLGKTRYWSPSRLAGIFIVLGAATGLLAIPGADQPDLRESVMARAGALGAFFVEWDGLRLVGQFGDVGAGLILSGLMVVGLVLTTGRGLKNLAGSTMPRWRSTTFEQDKEPEIGSEDETPAPVSTKKTKVEPSDSVQKARPGLFVRVFRGWGDRRSRGEQRATLLKGVDDGGWEDPVDDDVAAAARALEVHEWERRIQSRIKVRHDRRGAVLEDDFLEEEDIETIDESDEIEMPEEDEGYEYEDEASEEREAEFEEDGELEEEGTEEENDDIVFTDNSAPLPITKGNPANVGQGLAKLFPTRWPKTGTPAGSDKQEEETPEEVFDKSEARQLRRMASKLEEDPDTGDPLFNADFDTRPYGPNGEPLDLVEDTEQPPVSPAVYHMPEIEFLADPPQIDARMTREEMMEMSQTLSQTLADFGIDGKVVEVHQGPVVTRFEYRPAAGIKVSRITGLEHDIAMGMKALSVRILAPIPGKNTVGIEVPNKKRQGVYLKELISCEDFWEHKSALAFALGKTIDGSPHFADLARMPHLLIAGATGAGKSVCLNTIICSFLYRRSPDDVKMIMVDPKRVELSVYSDIPHLIAPVVCEPKRAASALEWAVEEMERRYEQLVEFGVRNIDGYNRLAKNPEGHRKTVGRSIQPMPYIVIVVDELADLMIVAKAEVEESIQRLAQMARAVGIHLILATQRPSVNVITGIIKANFPSRIAFQVSQKVDSRTILDSNGAEALLGKGDMLLSSGGAAKPVRIQGAFLSDEEVEHIADHCRSQRPVQYIVEEFEPKLSEKEQKELARMMGVQDMSDLDAQDRMVRGTNKVMGKVSAGMFIPHEGGSARAGDEEIDEALVRAAARLILESRKASVSLLQRRLKVGFARAGRLMDMLEEMGVVGEFKGSKPREIIVDPEAALEELDKLETALAEGVPVEELMESDEEEYGDEGEYEGDYDDEEQA